MTKTLMVPETLRVHLAHATVQAIADEVGADVLHIKGPATDPSLRPNGRASADADVLVRPSHLKQFLEGLKRFDWIEVIPMRDGSIVQHSTNWFHPQLGQLDVHVRFPGIRIDAPSAFDVLWEGHGTQEIAHRPCTIPSLRVQRLILLLHAARGLTTRASDVNTSWEEVPPEEQAEIRELAKQLDAEVALAAAIGELDRYRDRPEYELWRMFLVQYDLVGIEWLRAVTNAAPRGIRWARLRIIGFVLGYLWRLPKRLEKQLGRKPSLNELARRYAALARRAVISLKLINRPVPDSASSRQRPPSA